MGKLIYILCCFLSLCVTLYMVYGIIMQLVDEPLTIHLFTKTLACAGWGFITYEIIARKYKWVQKLCK